MTVELKKLSILEWVAGLSNKQVINDLYESIPLDNRVETKFDFSTAIKYSDLKDKKFDLEQVKKDQNYTGVDEDQMNILISQLDIEQSIEELLNDLD